MARAARNGKVRLAWRPPRPIKAADVAARKAAMKICLYDDSVPFDAWTPSRKPLGGAEKAFALLPGPLAGRGHEVHVYNRCKYSMPIEGARWHNPDSTPTTDSDALIAFRRPTLLESLRRPRRRILWATAAPEYLTTKAALPYLKDMGAELMFVSQAQRQRYKGDRPATVVIPGVATAYHRALPREENAPPRAVVTTHPSHGLDWLLDLWRDEIRPKVPDAQLDIYSAGLDRHMLEPEKAPDALRPLAEKCAALEEHGVAVLAPLGDEGMAKAYAGARVHLYPGHPDDMACWTLAESQAAGLPCVARAFPAVTERVDNGQTGYLVPDSAAFSNVAIELLTNDAMFESLSEAAREPHRRRTWAAAAAEVDALLTGGAG